MKQWSKDHLRYVLLGMAIHASSLLQERLQREQAQLERRIEADKRLVSHLELQNPVARIHYLPESAQQGFMKAMEQEATRSGFYREVKNLVKNGPKKPPKDDSAARAIQACKRTIQRIQRSGNIQYDPQTAWLGDGKASLGGFVLLANGGNPPENAQKSIMLGRILQLRPAMARSLIGENAPPTRSAAIACLREIQARHATEYARNGRSRPLGLQRKPKPQGN